VAEIKNKTLEILIAIALWPTSNINAYFIDSNISGICSFEKQDVLYQSSGRLFFVPGMCMFCIIV
jgi:hypothetical protein